MLPEALREPALGLFALCVAASAMDQLTQDHRTALSFRSLCALATAVCAARIVLAWFMLMK